MRHLTVSEAAEALHLSVPTIKRYIYDGKLKSIKLPGGQHRIPEREIERLLALGGRGAEASETTAETVGSLEQRILMLERWVTELEAEVERLSAALQVVSRYCARKCPSVAAAMGEPPEQEPRRVTILGPGCRRCNALHTLAARVLRGAGRADVVVERVTNLDDIAAYGPVLTPALIVGDEVVIEGRVPTEEALKDLLMTRLS